MRHFTHAEATTVSQIETPPSTYPATPTGGMSAAAMALAPALVWDRIESYIAWRWTSRAVVWIAEGPGDWKPTLTPATITLVENWDPTKVWVSASPALDPSPLGGYELPWIGPYRFTGTAGGSAPPLPEAAKEAFRRLANYMGEAPSGEDVAGATNFRIILAQRELEMEWQRAQSWLARAMSNSGAGDLLRPYRRAQ